MIDSGLGGLTVMAALRRRLPLERMVYFGDTARLPWGSKSPAIVTRFVAQIIRWLQRFQPKHVVLACNTASALALAGAREAFPGLPISGVIEPVSRAVADAAGPEPSPLIAVIATEATVRSGAFERALSRRRPRARILQRGAPLLAPILEEGRDGDDPLVALAVRQYVQSLVERRPDVLLLGCTHYPLLRRLIASMFEPSTRIIDAAEPTAEDVARRLGAAGLLIEPGAADEPPGCYVTDDSPRFARLGSRFFGQPLPTPRVVPLDELEMPAATDALRSAG